MLIDHPVMLLIPGSTQEVVFDAIRTRDRELFVALVGLMPKRREYFYDSSEYKIFIAIIDAMKSGARTPRAAISKLDRFNTPEDSGMTTAFRKAADAIREDETHPITAFVECSRHAGRLDKLFFGFWRASNEPPLVYTSSIPPKRPKRKKGTRSK